MQGVEETDYCQSAAKQAGPPQFPRGELLRLRHQVSLHVAFLRMSGGPMPPRLRGAVAAASAAQARDLSLVKHTTRVAAVNRRQPAPCPGWAFRLNRSISCMLRKVDLPKSVTLLPGRGASASSSSSLLSGETLALAVRMSDWNSTVLLPTRTTSSSMHGSPESACQRFRQCWVRPVTQVTTRLDSIQGHVTTGNRKRKRLFRARS